MSDKELQRIHEDLCRLGRDITSVLTKVEGYKQDIEKILAIHKINQQAKEYEDRVKNTQDRITF